jgi:hypothetical protein
MSALTPAIHGLTDTGHSRNRCDGFEAECGLCRDDRDIDHYCVPALVSPSHPASSCPNMDGCTSGTFSARSLYTWVLRPHRISPRNVFRSAVPAGQMQTHARSSSIPSCENAGGGALSAFSGTRCGPRHANGLETPFIDPVFFFTRRSKLPCFSRLLQTFPKWSKMQQKNRACRREKNLLLSIMATPVSDHRKR